MRDTPTDDQDAFLQYYFGSAPSAPVPQQAMTQQVGLASPQPACAHAHCCERARWCPKALATP